MLGSLSDTGGPHVVDAVVKNLATLRDEGFSRVWMTQASFELDVLTVLAVALREVDTIVSARPFCRSRISTQCFWLSAHSCCA